MSVSKLVMMAIPAFEVLNAFKAILMDQVYVKNNMLFSMTGSTEYYCRFESIEAYPGSPGIHQELLAQVVMQALLNVHLGPQDGLQ